MRCESIHDSSPMVCRPQGLRGSTKRKRCAERRDEAPHRRKPHAMASERQRSSHR
jgi:hypothetical protein